MNGRSIGRAGESLGDGFARNRGVEEAGRAGEVAAAAALESVVARGATVLHDLRVPVPGIKANIDHVLVSGRRVRLIDAKAWAAGIYWTVGGATHRGLARFEHADTATLQLARTGVEAMLRKASVEAELEESVVAVWGSGPRLLWAYRPRAARAMTGERFSAWLRRVDVEPAANDVVEVLRQLRRR